MSEPEAFSVADLIAFLSTCNPGAKVSVTVRTEGGNEVAGFLDDCSDNRGVVDLSGKRGKP